MLWKHKIALSNTDNFTCKCFLFADFKCLNLIRNLKVEVPRIDKRSRDITYLRTRLWNGIFKIVPYHLQKAWALQVHCHINMWFRSTTCQAKIYLQSSNCVGIKEWCIVTWVITPASAEQAKEGHQYRCMHLHKKYFDALI